MTGHAGEGVHVSAGGLAEFGTAMVSLGKFEQGHLADGFINLGEKASSLARSSQV